MTETRQYTKKEIAESDVKKEMLIIIHDEVYDVRVFLNEHPGGEEILLDHRAKDATEDFDDVGHSTDALELMKKYKVGELVAHERTNIPHKAGWAAGYDSKEAEKYVSGPGLPFYLLVIGVIGVIVALVFINA